MKINKTRFKRTLKFIPWIATLILGFSTIFLAHKSGYLYRALLHLGISDEKISTDYTLISWERNIEQLRYDSDIVFFGDSITSMCDYQSFFPDVNIVNLGLSGNTILQMKSRTSMIKSVNPEKIFIMAGVNSLNKGLEKTFSQYTELISTISEENPDAELYIISTLPISKSKESGTLNNNNIISLNESLSEFCTSSNIPFIDVHSKFYKDGYMNPELTKDGVHLHQESYKLIIESINPYI